MDGESVYRRWHEVVGEAISSHTRVVDVQAGVLHVDVDSPALLQELATYYREKILESLREHEDFGNIREIRFRAGSF